MKKCIFVLATDDYSPELCALTLPLIQQYAERIRADFVRLSERKFPEFPLTYERMQIYELGRDYDWNLAIDADLLIGPQTLDCTEKLNPANVGFCMRTDVRAFFEVDDDPYFTRDGRYWGVVDLFVASSRLTHDLWEPLPGPFSNYLPKFKDGNHRRISEYCLSRNLARYGLKAQGAFAPGSQLFHINQTSEPKEHSLELALAKLREWGVERPAN